MDLVSHDQQQQQQHVTGKTPQGDGEKAPQPKPWIPASLVNFNLHPVMGSASLPLSAVVPEHG